MSCTTRLFPCLYSTCVDCFQSAYHPSCSDPCDRRLLCGHVCETPCSFMCGPCHQVCEMKCDHGSCKQSCSRPCDTCEEPCTYKCVHFQCTKLCHEVCDRPPCNKPCPKKLKCGHQCVGFCGEECPPSCLICDNNILTEETMLLLGVVDDRYEPNLILNVYFNIKQYNIVSKFKLFFILIFHPIMFIQIHIFAVRSHNFCKIYGGIHEGRKIHSWNCSKTMSLVPDRYLPLSSILGYCECCQGGHAPSKDKNSWRLFDDNSNKSHNPKLFGCIFKEEGLLSRISWVTIIYLFDNLNEYWRNEVGK